MSLTLQKVIDKSASHRSLGNEIEFIESDKFPFVSMVPKGTQSNANVLDEWPVSKREDGDLNVQVESDASSWEEAFENDGLIKNRVQYSRIDFRVGRRAMRSQNLAGRARIWAQAVVDKQIKAKRQWEKALCSDVTVREASGPLGDISRGVGDFLLQTPDAATPAAYVIPSAHRTPTLSRYDGALSSLALIGSTSSFQALGNSIYNEVKDTTSRVLLCGSLVHDKISNYTIEQTPSGSNVMVRRFDQSVSDKRISTIVNVLQTPSITLEVVRSAWLAAFTAAGANNSTTVQQARGYLLKLANWQLVTPVAPSLFEEAETIGGRKASIEWEYVLRCLNPRGEGCIAGTGA